MRVQPVCGLRTAGGWKQSVGPRQTCVLKALQKTIFQKLTSGCLLRVGLLAIGVLSLAPVFAEVLLGGLAGEHEVGVVEEE